MLYRGCCEVHREHKYAARGWIYFEEKYDAPIKLLTNRIGK